MSRQPQRRPRYKSDPPFPKSMASGQHWTRREGDEMACSCGKRWPSDEEHP